MGPLKGMKVLEVGGIGPGPFCGQMLSDMGADVIRLDRRGAKGHLTKPEYNIANRGRRSVALDLKTPEGVETFLNLVNKADALIEGFRPGVMERLGLGPAECWARNPKLVYGRMTGWGQDGPLAQAAGHDINYISLSGTLHAIGNKGEKPGIPLNLVGDFGGGGMYLAFGIMCGVFEARQSGNGQVVDAAMLEGSALLMGMFYGLHASGSWNKQRGTNFLDGGSHFYNTYETADGKWISVGSIEPQFYSLLVQKAEIEGTGFDNQMDAGRWPDLKEQLAGIFKQKTRDEWCQIMEGIDVCFAPILAMDEVLEHPHNQARKTFININGITQPAPGPRFSRTQPAVPEPPPGIGQHNESALLDWGIASDIIQSLKDKQII